MRGLLKSAGIWNQCIHAVYGSMGLGVWATTNQVHAGVTRAAARAHCLKLKTICTTAASWTKRVSLYTYTTIKEGHI